MNGDWTVQEPEEYGEYLITWTGELGGKRQKPFLEFAKYEPDNWIVDHIEERGYKNIEVTAWVPLPEPYREEEG